MPEQHPEPGAFTSQVSALLSSSPWSHLPVDAFELSVASSSKQSIKQKGLENPKIKVMNNVSLCSKELTSERTTGQTDRRKEFNSVGDHAYKQAECYSEKNRFAKQASQSQNQKIELSRFRDIAYKCYCLDEIIWYHLGPNLNSRDFPPFLYGMSVFRGQSGGERKTSLLCYVVNLFF